MYVVISNNHQNTLNRLISRTLLLPLPHRRRSSTHLVLIQYLSSPNLASKLKKWCIQFLWIALDQYWMADPRYWIRLDRYWIGTGSVLDRYWIGTGSGWIGTGSVLDRYWIRLDRTG